MIIIKGCKINGTVVHSVWFVDLVRILVPNVQLHVLWEHISHELTVKIWNFLPNKNNLLATTLALCQLSKSKLTTRTAKVGLTLNIGAIFSLQKLFVGCPWCTVVFRVLNFEGWRGKMRNISASYILCHSTLLDYK